MIETFALICMTWGSLMIIIAALLATHSHQDTDLVTEGLEDSDIELSIAWNNIKVYNGIFDETNNDMGMT